MNGEALANNTPKGRGFTIYWVSGDIRVPIEICQVPGRPADEWEVLGAGWCIAKIYIRQGEYYYHDTDYCIDDIQSIVDAITDFTGEGMKLVRFYKLGEPTGIARYPPNFEPMFKDPGTANRWHRRQYLISKGQQKVV